jgi:pyrimidine operon attenuation protein/uracil phosphoribosyltransferase
MLPNRTVCDVLKEMREAHKQHNYSYLLGLIEEVQSMANRMESALHDRSDFKYSLAKAKKLKAEIKELKKKKKDLGGEDESGRFDI